MAQVQDVATSVDLSNGCQNSIELAIAVTTGRLKLDSPSETVRLLRNGDQDAMAYFRHEVANQAALVLVRVDDRVREVYLEHEIPEAEDAIPGDIGLADAIHLVVYSDRETAALRSLLDALDQALGNALSEKVDRVSPGFLQAEIIDRGVVRHRIGRVGGFHPRPMLLVTREG